MYAGSDLPRTKQQFVGHEDFKTWMHNRRGLFPGLHSLLAFALYGVPIIAGIELGLCPSVLYWIGWFSWLVLLVPVFLIASHLVHAVKRKPQFNAMVLSTVVPALVVMGVGYSVMMPISGITDRLTSSDCTTYSDKTYLNSAYEAAAKLWDQCLLREAIATGKNVTELKASFSIDMCKEYQDSMASGEGAQKWRRQWNYLQSLEVNQDCSGWCYAGQESLWTTDHDAKDICSSIVGSILNVTVKREASRMLVTGLFALVVSLAALVAVQEYMIRLGVEW
mmetsp:Transcript_47696/g.147024  ORF Transcript_47696/g.147024 Transcript_47696/m.147024 type:complete len:279 (+) Transcript_47696:115-951(+)